MYKYSNISSVEAQSVALRAAGIASADFHEKNYYLKSGYGLYELDYSTDYMEYCCYINAETGEVVGFDCEPRVA